jgi:hypothetical protein
MTKTSGSGDRDPDIAIFQNGDHVTMFESSLVNTKRGSRALSSGVYILEIYDYNNVDDVGTTGNACFSISISN